MNENKTKFEEFENDTPLCKFNGISKYLVKLVAIFTSLLYIWILAFNPIEAWLHRATLLFLTSVITFLIKPGFKNKKISFLECLLILFSFCVWLYILLNRDGMIWRAGVLPENADVLFGILSIIIVIEMVRRHCGLSLPIIVIILILYALLGQYIPGIFGHKGVDYKRLVSFVYSPLGIYGSILGASSTFVFMFVVFGSFLQVSGVGKFFTDFALSITGKSRGGPSKMAIVSSSLFGMISGSSTSNVVTTGTFTIPLMKSIGYKSVFAGAVEAVASAGGQIMPPIMGVAAFVMVELTEVPYSQIVKMAIFPALLYYMGIFCMVDFEAEKTKLPKLAKKDIPSFIDVLKKGGYLSVPIFVLLFCLIKLNLSPIRSAQISILSVLLASSLKLATRIDFKKLLNALESASINVCTVVGTCAIAGIVVGILNLTGIGLSVGNIIIFIASGNLPLALFLTMILCLLLGMGMPTVAAYAVCAAVAVPPLVKMGVPFIIAHFFIFYYAVLSTITPPVALSAYVAASIARANQTSVGYMAFKLAIPGFIVPYMFVYGPSLLLIGNVSNLILSIPTAIIGTFSLACAIQGWFLGRLLTLYSRFVFLLAALFLIKPGFSSDLIGVLLLIIFTATHYFKKQNRTKRLV